MKCVRVSAAVIHRGDSVYATRRSYGEYKGFWEFPGGKREEGESGEEALIREIREELSSDIHIDRLITTVEYQMPTFLLVMDAYLCTLEGGDLHLSVHDDAIWLKKSELNTLKWLPADLLVIEKLG